MSDDELIDNESETEYILSDNEEEECSEDNSKKFNLALKRTKTSFLEEIEMIELIPIERIKALLKSNCLLEHWKDNDKTQRTQSYKNEIEQIKAYLKKYDRERKGIPIKYIKPKHRWGRPFPEKSLGLTSMRRKVRNTLIQDLYIDYDLKNSQPSIIVLLCKDNNIECEIIEDYCKNREKWIDRTMKMYGCDKRVAKDLFITICFGGSLEGWVYLNKITKEKLPTKRIKEFENKIKEISNIIKSKNPELYETARKKREKQEPIKTKEQTKTSKCRDKVLSSMLGLYLQEWEYIIVGSIKEYLYDNTDLYKNTLWATQKSKILVGTFEYDGIKLYKKNVEQFEKTNANVLEYINKITNELYGIDDAFKLEWAVKEIEDPYDISEAIEEIEEIEKPNEELMKLNEFLVPYLRNDDKGMCDLIKQSPYGEYYIYSVCKNEKNGEWKCWDEDKNRWTNGDSILRRDLSGKIADWLKSLIEPFEKYKVEGENVKKSNFNSKLTINEKIYMELSTQLNCKIKLDLMRQKGNNDIVGKAKGEFRNDTIKFDTNIDLFGCENGVIDIEKETFRNYRYNDFVSMTNSKGDLSDNFKPFMKGLKTEIKIKAYNLVEIIDANTNEHITYREPTREEFNILKVSYEDKYIINEELAYFYMGVFNNEGKLIENRQPTIEEKHLYKEDKPTGYVNNFRIIKNDEASDYDKKMINDINEQIEKIIPNEELRNYLWLILSSGLTGKAIEKLFIFNGGGRNGKGLINDFMRYCLGEYACELSVNVLTEDPSKTNSGGSNVEKAKLDKKRYVITAEPNGRVKLNNSTIKKLTGGGELSARMNFSNNSVVSLNLTLILECNKKPPFYEEPMNADKDRINDILFSSRFTDKSEEWGKEFEKEHIYKQNAELKTPLWFKEHKNAFLNMLFAKVLQLKKQNWNIDLYKPQSVKDRSEEYLNKSSDIYSIFKTLFEKDNCDRRHYYTDWNGVGDNAQEDWSISKVIIAIRQTEDYINLIKDRQKKADYGSVKQIREWIMTRGTPLNPFVIEDKRNNQVKLKNWRRYIENDENDD